MEQTEGDSLLPNADVTQDVAEGEWDSPALDREDESNLGVDAPE